MRCIKQQDISSLPPPELKARATEKYIAMVEVFKTNVHEAGASEQLKHLLRQHFPSATIDFDLEDCDRILRITPCPPAPQQVVDLLARHGYECEVLD